MKCCHHKRCCAVDVQPSLRHCAVTYRRRIAGFLVLQHLLESREKMPIADILDPFLASCGLGLGLSFEQRPPCKHVAEGYRDSGAPAFPRTTTADDRQPTRSRLSQAHS